MYDRPQVTGEYARGSVSGNSLAAANAASVADYLR